MEYRREMVKSCENLESLFEIWKNKPIGIMKYKDQESNEMITVTIDHSQVFISDGPICEKSWKQNENGKRILFLLKEAYGGYADWSLNDWLRKTGPSSSIWYRVVEWTYGILNTTRESIPRYSPENISFNKSENEPNEWLRQIAVVNIKKSGGRSSSDYGEIHAYAKHDKEEIIREIELLDPDIIVCGGTAAALNEICDGKIKQYYCDNWYYYSNAIGGRERLFIDYYHPANRYPALLNYYGIVNIYQQALIGKEL